jgi:membrane associated rhomboid family serine protease
MSNWSPPAAEQACYRHPKVQAPITCNICQRPICTSCMISAPVGWQCPSCVKGAPAVRRMRDIQPGGSLTGGTPYLTYGIVATCVAIYIAQQGGGIEARFVIVASEVARGELWRVVSSGFLHGSILHLLFNMVVLFQLGSAIEARLGRARFLAVYILSLVGGSLGALLLQPPNTAALGASGAVFGLMGAAVVLPRRGRSPIEASIGGLLLINLVITFVIPNISIGGHLGGLLAGAVGGLVIRAFGDRADARRIAVTTALLVALTAGLFLTAQPLADWKCSQEPQVTRRGPVGSSRVIEPCP